MLKCNFGHRIAFRIIFITVPHKTHESVILITMKVNKITTKTSIIFKIELWSVEIKRLRKDLRHCITMFYFTMHWKDLYLSVKLRRPSFSKTLSSPLDSIFVFLGPSSSISLPPWLPIGLFGQSWGCIELWGTQYPIGKWRAPVWGAIPSIDPTEYLRCESEGLSGTAQEGLLYILAWCLSYKQR